MRRILIFILTTFFVISGCNFISKEKVAVKQSQPKESQITTISIKNNKFVPEKVEVRVKDKVVFFNEDEVVHQVSIGEKGGIPLKKGASWTYVFDSSGSFTIYDVLNKKVKGEVVVK